LSEYVKKLEAMVEPSTKTNKSINSPPTALIKPQPKVVPPIEQPDIVKDSENSKIEFINVKDRVKGMEKSKISDKLNKQNENNEKNANNFDKTMTPTAEEPASQNCDVDHIDNGSDLPESDQGNGVDNNNPEELIEQDDEHKTNGFGDERNVEHSSLNGNSVTSVPPKPMPRSSISDAGSGEDSYCNVNVVNGVPRPVAKPRTTTQTNMTGYKVTIGIIYEL
jgi:hypothetical protein